ncbi:TonB-dependent receptor [Actimicrobium antarcticum]|uniref:TonB-dependent receptor n=1 Tax=Actimicrobium antarcticum TaxID=1051899 RepID=A0ABP7TZZ8_9BURK
MAHFLRIKPLTLLILQALAFSAQAQEAAPVTEVITVFGQGQTRQLQKLTQDDLAKALPGTSPLKTLEKLPGVSFQSADPFGAYEWSTRFSVRGFNQNQMGFTLDGVPLGDMSYGNNNGLHISRAISSENIGRVNLSQGSGAVGTASTSNLGGTVQFVSMDPSDKMGGTFAQTFGSDSTFRTFVRVDSGLLPSDTKIAVSLTRHRSDKWKGEGSQDLDQFNSKLVQRFGDNKLSVFYNHSDRKEIDYQDMSLEMTRRLGAKWDNYAPNFQQAVNAARGIYTAGETSIDDAYYQASGLRKDDLAGATLEVNLTPSTVLKTTLYHHHNEGQGHWYTPYVATSAAMPISIRTTEYKIGRDGVISDLTWDAGQHSINGGFWAERSLHNVTRNYYAVIDNRDTNTYLSNPFRTDFKQDYTTTTTQFYLQDTVSMLDDKLKLNLGFKSPKVAIDSVSVVGTRAAGSVVATKSFLPQIGLNYALTKDDELFASLAENMRAFSPGIGGVFSQSQASFNASSTSLKPETSTSLDLGYRFKRAQMSGSVAVYHAEFKDRQLGIANCPAIVGCASTFANVGKVITNGVEAAAELKLAPQWSWFNSLTYNDSQYKSDYLDGAIVPVSGKQVVDAPKLMFNTELAYENEHWFARTNAKFTDKRYYTYLNDASVPKFWLLNLTAGYKMKSFGALKDVSIQLNVDNLLNKDYFSTIGSNGFSKSDPSGTSQTLLTGAPRQMFLTIGGKI